MWRNLFRHPPTEPTPPGWDQRQRAVIAAPAGTRLLVDGGPGTGKTAVACARVARLIAEEHLPPESIWLISFTRTAVAEIRNRIVDTIGDADLAHAVRIATLDSLAWSLLADPEAEESYDENIGRVLDLVKGSPEMAARLAEPAHLVVDEAHDIVGLRAELVATMLDRLSPTAGITVLVDEAQAIYGFADTAPGWGRETLIERLRQRADFTELRLETVFRSREPRLARLFREARVRLLDDGASVRRQIERFADGRIGPVAEQELSGRDDLLVLFRRRAEVLAASAQLHGAGIAHRLRLSGHPAGLAPWIAAALGDCGGAPLAEATFAGWWNERVAGTAMATTDAADAWAALRRLAAEGGGMIDPLPLRRQLAGERPPPELCVAEPGGGGPILGTIHASKGREAETVHLMLPATGKGRDNGEEARVAFVGATRARRHLRVGTAPPELAERLPSGRLCRLDQTRPAAWVEIGRDGDAGAEAVAGLRHFANADEVANAQRRLAALAGRPVVLVGHRGDGGYRLETADGHKLAVLGEALLDDLDAIARRLSGSRAGGPFGPPELLPGLWLIGLRSLAVLPDPRLHRPWSEGGFLLCPIVTGYDRAVFPPLSR